LRDEIVVEFGKVSKVVVLIGDNTHTSEWVDWEVKKVFELKKALSGDNTWKRTRGTHLDVAVVNQAVRSSCSLTPGPAEGRSERAASPRWVTVARQHNCSAYSSR
jgi:hypothetical protein